MPTIIGAKHGAIAGTKAEIAIAPRPFRCESRGPDPRPSPRFLMGEMECSIQQSVKIWLFIIAQVIPVFSRRSRPKLKMRLKHSNLSNSKREVKAWQVPQSLSANRR